jgi:hypothetical protein
MLRHNERLGNLSSASVLFVLAELLEANEARPGEPGWLWPVLFWRANRPLCDPMIRTDDQDITFFTIRQRRFSRYMGMTLKESQMYIA